MPAAPRVDTGRSRRTVPPQHLARAERRPRWADRLRQALLAERFLLVWLLVGVVIRLLAAQSVWGGTDSDEATGILMVVQAAHGHFYVLFWGQNYGGMLMSWVEAPFVALLGLHIWFFRLANIFVVLVDAVLLRMVAGRLVTARAARLAAALFFLYPPEWVRWSLHEYIFWGPGVGLALAAAYCCLRSDEAEGDGWLWPVGLFAGACFWLYALLGSLVIAPIVAVAWSRRGRPVGIAKMLVLAPVGAAPWIYTTVAHHFFTFHKQRFPGQSVSQSLGRSISQVLPTTLLSSGPFKVSAHDTTVLGWTVFGAAVAFTIVQAARGRYLLALAGVPILLWPPILVASGVLVEAADYRYGFVLLPSLAVLLAYGVECLSAWRPLKAGALVAALAVAAAAFTVVGAARNTSGFRHEPTIAAVNYAVAGYLEAEDRTHIWAGYWVGYVLSVASDARVTVCPTSFVREPGVCTLADHAAESTYVFQAGQSLDAQMTSWSRAHHEGQRVVIGSYAVWLFDRQVPRSSLSLVGTF